MTPPTLRPLSVVAVSLKNFTLYRRHFGPLATVALVCTGLPLVLRLFLEAGGGLFTHVGLALLYTVVFVTLSLIATAATVFIVSESYLGRPITAREALNRSAPYVTRILLCTLLLGLVVFVGFVLLVIPGIVLAVGLALAVPVVVLEPRTSASGALSRSWELTRGARWRIFALGLTLLVLIYVPVAAIGGLFALVAPQAALGHYAPAIAATVIAIAVGGLVQMFIYPLLYCVLTVTYYDLRVRKEGFDLELLASSLQTA